MNPFSDNFWPMSLLLGLVLVSGCDSKQEREYSGFLYFGAGSYLGQLDLRDGSVAVLANLGDAEIEEVSPFGDEQLLLSVFGPVTRKDPFRLMHYEFDSGGRATLIRGRHGRYLPQPEALIFDDGAHLNVRLYSESPMQELSVVQHRFGASVRILPVSDTRFLYSIDPDTAIAAFDVELQESKPLAALSARCGLGGAIWIAERAAVLCKRQEDVSNYALIRLDGTVQEVLEIPDASRFRALAYLADQDALVLTEQWQTLVSGSKKHAVWIYDLKNDAMLRLAENQHLGSSVVYRRN